jgi:hypothetical protein
MTAQELAELEAWVDIAVLEQVIYALQVEIMKTHNDLQAAIERSAEQKRQRAITRMNLQQQSRLRRLRALQDKHGRELIPLTDIPRFIPRKFWPRHAIEAKEIHIDDLMDVYRAVLISEGHTLAPKPKWSGLEEVDTGPPPPRPHPGQPRG